MLINNNNYSIAEILAMLGRRELIVNNEYQRGSGLWPDGPSSYFVDTILQGYPFPKIYLYERFDNRGEITKEIVDGQQRIKTIQRYRNDEFPLNAESPYRGLRYSQLDDEVKQSFLSYTVSVDVIRNARSSDILQMFRRMNAYTLPLNDAEQRHSIFQGPFKWFVNDLTDSLNEFFVEFGVFKDRQIVRMLDAELVTDCVLAIERGVVSTSASDLRAVYKKYDETFQDSDAYKQRIMDAVRFITTDLEPLRNTHMMKPYALHSLITALIQNRSGIAAVDAAWGVQPIGRYAAVGANPAEALLGLAHAHEAKELDGPYAKYVWGCLGGTNRAPRRTARVAAILRALGTAVPDAVDANLA